MRKWLGLVFILIILFVEISFSQTDFHLNGSILDDWGNELPYIQVQLFQKDGHGVKLKTYQWADSLGKFNLKLNIPIQNGFLVFNALGWKTDTLMLPILVLKSQELSPFFLKPDPLQLTEIVVAEKALPYLNRSDTTIFKPSFFADGSEIVLEDILVKLPGVRISEEGFLFFRGKQVDKILWDGDNLLGNDYAKAIKKLSVGLANEFKFLDKFEDNPLMKSLKQSNQLVLDIEIKNSFKGQWIGDSQVEMGISPMAGAGFNGYKIKKKLKSIFLVKAISFNDTPEDITIAFDPEDLMLTFAPNVLSSWHVFPSSFPYSLKIPRIYQGKLASLMGGLHLKIGKESYLNFQMDALLQTSFFETKNEINQLLWNKKWIQNWLQNEHIQNQKFGGDGRFKLSDNSNVSYRYNLNTQIYKLEKSDTLTDVMLVPLVTSESMNRKKFLSFLKTDWIFKHHKDLIWKIKSLFQTENLLDTYYWQKENLFPINTQQVNQTNRFARIQVHYVRPNYHFEIGIHQQNQKFDAFQHDISQELQKITLTQSLFWLGGNYKWQKKAHTFSATNTLGIDFFKWNRGLIPDINLKKTILWESNLTYAWTLNKKWKFESTHKISPMMPDAGLLYLGAVKTGILQSEKGQSELIIPTSRQFRNRILFSNPKNLWESQVLLIFNHKTPYLGNRVFYENQTNWIIEKYPFRLSKGMLGQWNLDKYFIQNGASLGMQLSMSKQNLFYVINKVEGENLFYSFSSKLDIRFAMDKVKFTFSPTWIFRKTKSSLGNNPEVMQVILSGNILINTGKKSYLKLFMEYLPPVSTGNNSGFWAKMEMSFPIQTDYMVKIECRNLFNNNILKIGDLWTESELIQQFKINPTLLLLTIRKEF